MLANHVDNPVTIKFASLLRIFPTKQLTTREAGITPTRMITTQGKDMEDWISYQQHEEVLSRGTSYDRRIPS